MRDGRKINAGGEGRSAKTGEPSDGARSPSSGAPDVAARCYPRSLQAPLTEPPRLSP